MADVVESNCLPMCSLCTMPQRLTISKFARCGACKKRTYCSKKCQIQDWKLAKHKQFCGEIAIINPTTNNNNNNPKSKHEPFCAYLNRNPQLDNNCLVETNKIKSNPQEVITTGMNTCFFIVIKTTKEVIGWHASLESDFLMVRKKFQTISKKELVSAFVVPGEDRVAGTLDLKPTCRQMLLLPFTDPTHSRRVIFNFLKEFDWLYSSIEVMPSVQSYKDFVVFDMVHRKPFTFSDVAQFDQGCSFDAGTAAMPLGFFH